MGATNRGSGRFEVRVYIPASAGPGARTLYTRTSKLELGLMALSELARSWANKHGAVVEGTTVDLIDTTDGGPIAQLKYLGFASGTLEAALNTLKANGFEDMQEIVPAGKSLAGKQ